MLTIAALKQIDTNFTRFNLYPATGQMRGRVLLGFWYSRLRGHLQRRFSHGRSTARFFQGGGQVAPGATARRFALRIIGRPAGRHENRRAARERKRAIRLPSCVEHTQFFCDTLHLRVWDNIFLGENGHRTLALT